VFGRIGATYVAPLFRSNVCARDHHSGGEMRGSALSGMTVAWGTSEGCGERSISTWSTRVEKVLKRL
jgi:hypothetical protein